MRGAKEMASRVGQAGLRLGSQVLPNLIRTLLRA